MTVVSKKKREPRGQEGTMTNLIALILIVTVQTGTGKSSGSAISTMQVGTFDSLAKCQAAVAGSKLIEAPKASSGYDLNPPNVNFLCVETGLTELGEK